MMRYVDDFVVLTEKRWPLRRAIAALNGYLNTEGFECHPDKTQTGRLVRGFDWCGIDFVSGHRPCISGRTYNKHRDTCRRLEEQLRARGLPEAVVRARVQAYETRWTTWARGLVRAATIKKGKQC